MCMFTLCLSWSTPALALGAALKVSITPRAARPVATDHSKIREDLFNLVRVSRREWR